MEIIGIIIGSVITIVLVVGGICLKQRAAGKTKHQSETIEVSPSNGHDDWFDVIAIYDDQQQQTQAIGQQLIVSLTRLGFKATSHEFASIEVSQDIPRWITEKLNATRNVLLLCTEHFKAAFDQTDASTASTSGRIIYYAGQVLKGRQASECALIVPLILKRKDTKFIPETFKCKEWFRISSGELTERDRLVRLLGHINECKMPKMNRINNHTGTDDSQSAVIEPVMMKMTSCW
jgi:hypothetical protein